MRPVLLLLLLEFLATQVGVPSSRQTPPSRICQAARVNQELRVDGLLDDPAWSDAQPIGDFTQREPHNGDAASERTEVRVVYTGRTIFIGARLFDSQASRIIAAAYQRDSELTSDDTFEVCLDTFHDFRNAFYFASNALGTQRDGLVRNEGEDLNWQWDGVWSVATSRDADGWTVEMAIPFSTLRFNGSSLQEWGLNFGRLVARSREESYWVPLSRQFGYFGKWRVSAYGSLHGLGGIESHGRIRLWPFAVGGYDRDWEETQREPNGVTAQAGIDAKVALGSSIGADLTYHTDFAQVESDQQQVNLTRFPLFYPEKRTFFLENAGLFQVGERRDPFEPPSTLLFFSRTIGLSEDGDVIPIIGGVRLTGKTGPWDFGAFDIVTDRANYGPDADFPRTNFAAVRLKRDVLRRSTVGAFYLSKTPADEGGSNQVAAVDANLAFGESFSLMGFAARSSTTGLTGSSNAFNIDAALNKDRYGWGLSYADIGDDFNSEMGFLQRTGVRKYRGNQYLSFRPEWPGVRRVFMFVDGRYISDRENRLQTMLASVGPAIMFTDGSFLFGTYVRDAEGLTEPFELREDVYIPVGTYRGNQFLLQYMGSRSHRISFRGGIVAGAFYGGTLGSYTIGVDGRPHQRLDLGVEYSRNNVNVPVSGGIFQTNLAVGRATFAFSPRSYIRAMVQWDDDSREMRTNVMYRYIYKPGADFYLVYDETQGILGDLPQLKKKKFVAKMTFYFVPK